MKIVKEMKNACGQAVYDVFLDEIFIKRIKIIRISRKYKGVNYVFLVNSNGRVIEEVFKFLNYMCKGETLNGREQAASALKLLYSFCEIISKDVVEFEKVDVLNLSDFLLGRSVEGNIESWMLSQSRSNSTHNQYLDIIRKYLKYIGVEDKIFFEKTIVYKEKRGYGMLTHVNNFYIEKYRTNKTHHTNSIQFIPEYISIEEYRNIITYICKNKSDFSIRDRLIIDLMFTRGLRIGEVLGITLEDIVPHPTNVEAGILYLRNRVTDRKYQCAKGCMKVFSQDMYKSKNYVEEGLGYQKVILPVRLMMQIKQYISFSRDVFRISEKQVKNIELFSKADCVNKTKKENFYLFLNKNGAPLSQMGWNDKLKAIFIQTGLGIDKNSKKKNLNHRFRHGYAMYLIEVMKKDISYVMKELRHRSIQSTMRYYNPKSKDILDKTEKIEASIQELLQIGNKESVK